MMNDHRQAGAILREYFAHVTHEQFLADVQKFCPEILEPEVQDGQPSSNAELPPMYAEVLDFLVTRPTFEQILAFKVSERSQMRLRELLDKNRSMSLTSCEAAELNTNEQLDALMTLLKVRARTTANASDSS
jgi:hypothetical protein